MAANTIIYRLTALVNEVCIIVLTHYNYCLLVAGILTINGCSVCNIADYIIVKCILLAYGFVIVRVYRLSLMLR